MDLVKDYKISQAEHYKFDANASIEDLQEQNKKNWKKAEKDIQAGKQICLSDLIGGAEQLYIKKLERNTN